jgi:hypothetical protein
MCLKHTFDIATTLFVVYGTYLLSRQLFIENVIEQFKRNLLNYKKYEDVPILFKLAGLCYGFTKDNWINADTGFGSERPINKLSNPAAPFKGFLCICIAAVFQIIAIFLF